MSKPAPKAVRQRRPRASNGAHRAPDNPDRGSEKKLDRTIEDSFPASDPPPTTPGAD